MTSEQPDTFIQWKNTDLCAEFRCPCGNDYHLDGYCISTVHCPNCGRYWRLEPRLELTELSGPEENEHVVELGERFVPRPVAQVSIVESARRKGYLDGET